jgi:hypothetical protein
MSEGNVHPDKLLAETPQSALEHQLIADYLLRKGYRILDLHKLPEQRAKKLRKEACLYAALKLAEVEARSKFRHEIEAP